MSRVLYAIADCEAGAVPGRGPDGSNLHAVGERPVAVLGEAPDGRREQLRAHELNVAALMAKHTVLPVRFGTPGREDELSALLKTRSSALGEALARVRGAVELGVVARLAVPAGDPGATGPVTGTEYLAQRLAARRSGRRIEALLEPLARLAREDARIHASPGRGYVRCAYLVDAGSVDTFVGRVRDVDTSSEEVELVCTGPWAPYSFTGDWL